MHNFVAGLQIFAHPDPWIWMIVGIIGGFVTGVIPGISGPNAIALLLPFSVFLTPVDALILMAGVYGGSAFGASIPGILLNIPGNAEAAAATLDGFALTQQGQSAVAIGISRMASVLGGSLGSIVALIIIGPLGAISLAVGPRELFIIGLCGMLMVGGLLGKPIWKGLLSAALGLLIAAMGADPVTSQTRLTFGLPQLFNGVSFVAAVIGVFAIPQMLELIEAGEGVPGASDGTGTSGVLPDLGGYREVREGIRITLQHLSSVFRAVGLGVCVGLIPGLGAAVGNFVAYGIEKQRSRHPERFGHGAPEGIIGPEACDNAISCATLVPTMTIGIPGGTAAALMLAALSLHGIEPGPEVLAHHGPEVYAVLISMFLGALLVLPLGIVFAKPLIFLTTRTPKRYMVPAVFILCLIGTFSYHNSVFDVWVCLLFGVLGYLMRKAGVSVVPLIIGLILGPLIESNLDRALELSNGSVAYFVGSPIALVLWAVLAVMIVLGLRQRSAARRAEQGTPGAC